MYCIFASRHRSVPFLLSYAFFAAAACRGQGLDKRLIEYGWDVPFVQDVRDRLPEMETKPFDGVVFKLKSGGMALQPVPLDPEAYKQDLEALRGIEWNRFTDSFIVLWSASNQDWFDDKDWSVICENIRLFAKAAREGGCAGLCFDPEPYGDNPWAYSETLHRQSKSFQEYQDVVRSRGVQFMTALNEEMPDCVLLFLFQLSVFRNDILSASQEERREKLSFHHYGLMPAFLNGLLEAAGEGITFVDGNESAYYYTDEADYFEAYHRVRQRGRLLIDRGLWPVYCRRVQMGQALYVDQYFGLRDKTVLGDRMTPQEQKDWFEHNAYWALYSSDRYVWCYSERMNWWTGQGVPAGAEQSLRSAALKIKNGEELGFDLEAK